MLRDLTATTSGGRGILGTHLVGVLASEIPTGFALPSLLANDVDAADPAGTLYREEILTWPSAGVLTVDEYGAFSFTGAPDGTYTGATKVYKNNAPQDGTYSFTIGTAAGSTSVSRDAALDYAIRARVDLDATLDYVIGGAVSLDAILSYAILGGSVLYTPSASRTIEILPGSVKPFGAPASGDFWDLSNAKKPRGVKDPNATLDITFDWTKWLADIGDTAALFTWSVNADGGLVKVAQGADEGRATIFVSGGTLGTATITCHITTSSNPPREEDRTITLTIEER